VTISPLRNNPSPSSPGYLDVTRLQWAIATI
jgi:hypothetical protein